MAPGVPEGLSPAVVAVRSPNPTLRAVEAARVPECLCLVVAAGSTVRRIESGRQSCSPPVVGFMALYGQDSLSFTTPKSMVELSENVEPAGTFWVQTFQLLSISWLRLPARS